MGRPLTSVLPPAAGAAFRWRARRHGRPRWESIDALPPSRCACGHRKYVTCLTRAPRVSAAGVPGGSLSRM